MEITKKEVLVSIIIVFIMLAIGFFISEKIQSKADEVNQRYDEAVQINDNEMFKYALRTAVGDAFVEGDYKGVDYVKVPALDGEYINILRVKERYTKHTRIVTHRSGKMTWNKVQHYWTWDEIGREEVHSKEVEFAGVTFDWNEITKPKMKYWTTIDDGYHLRSEYYVLKDTHGVMFGNIGLNKISETDFKETNIENAVNDFKKSIFGWIVLFWIIWIGLIGGLIYILYYNDWLN